MDSLFLTNPAFYYLQFYTTIVYTLKILKLIYFSSSSLSEFNEILNSYEREVLAQNESFGINGFLTKSVLIKSTT